MATSSIRMAYTAVTDNEGASRLAICVQGESGYHPCRPDSDAGGAFPSFEAAMEYAARFNKQLGLSKEEAMQIVLSTMKEVV